MTQRFILDENIVIFAQKRENAESESDSTCLDLLTQIITICHAIVVDFNLWDKYQHQLGVRSRTGAQAGSLVLALLDIARHTAGKIDFTHNAAPFPEEGDIPQGSQDDVPIVRLAVETGATLVTADRDLGPDLNSCGVQEKYNLRVLSPEEVLPKL